MSESIFIFDSSVKRQSHVSVLFEIRFDLDLNCIILQNDEMNGKLTEIGDRID